MKRTLSVTSLTPVQPGVWAISEPEGEYKVWIPYPQTPGFDTEQTPPWKSPWLVVWM